MIHCEKCGIVPVPEEQLPVMLPEVERYQPTDTGESPLANITEWVNTTCPTCSGAAKRETDVMPNWAGSSWYYLRYADAHNSNQFASPDLLKYWLTPASSPVAPGEGGVDWYNGGMEHTVLHLLYSRFWHKFLFDEGLVPTSEPYMKRTSHGLILAEDGSKMSKSKGNTVSPDALVEHVGADALRLYEMFVGPFDQPVAWNNNGVVGMRRFLERVADLVINNDTKLASALETLLHQTIKKVTEDIEHLKLNTAVSALMILLNECEKTDSISNEVYKIFLQLLAPFAPHLTHELWEQAGNTTELRLEMWPTADESKLKGATSRIMIQINGKIRGEIESATDADDATVEALAREVVRERIEGTTISRVIVVPNRLINFVVSEQ
jgi:leucyl-tRNA synthetase